MESPLIIYPERHYDDITPEQMAELIRSLEKLKSKMREENEIRKSLGLKSPVEEMFERIRNSEPNPKFIAQVKMLNELGDIEFAKEAPHKQAMVKKYTVPIEFKKIVNIYKWLCRNQIQPEHVPPEVWDVFITTRQYQSYLSRRDGTRLTAYAAAAAEGNKQNENPTP